MSASPPDRRPSVYEGRLQLLAVGLLASAACWEIASTVRGHWRTDPVRPAPASPGTPAPMDIRLDLNTADAAALEHLPGIGKKRAYEILAYRQRAGRFRSVDDLKNVPGIKDGIIRQLAPYVRVEPAVDVTVDADPVTEIDEFSTAAAAPMPKAAPPAEPTRGGQTLSSPPRGEPAEPAEPVLKKKRPRPKKPM